MEGFICQYYFIYYMCLIQDIEKGRRYGYWMCFYSGEFIGYLEYDFEFGKV